MTDASLSSSQSSAIYVENLRKVYRDKRAVEDLSLEVNRGEVFGFLGPNGAGKTTTIKMLNGLVRPTSGRLSVLGRPLGDMAARRRIGFLPEQFRFHEWLRAEEFLDFHGSLYGLSRAERRTRIPEVLALVGLEGRSRSRLRTFSKGMLQRIGIAQAVIADPLLVFLDEPTSALDPLGRRDVRDIIRRLQDRGVTVFLNSHLLGEVEAVCDRVAIIKDGKMAAMGPKHELLGGERVVEVRVSGLSDRGLERVHARYETVSVEQAARSDGVFASSVVPNTDRQRSEGASPVSAPADARISLMLSDEETPELVHLLVTEGACVHEVTPRQRSLEDLFVDVVQASGDR